MSLADLIKKGGLRKVATATPATVATQRTDYRKPGPPSVATLATVAVAEAPEEAASGVSPIASLPWRVTIPQGTKPETLEKFRAASLALDALQATELEPDANLDRWCWPASDAMNTAEIETFTARLSRFSDKGLTIADGEGLADKLVTRDRESDDRRVCLECVHLTAVGGWRCGNWRHAGVAIKARDAQLPTDFVNLLQRCDGFKELQWLTATPIALSATPERPMP